MFSRIAAGARIMCAPTGLPAGAHSLDPFDRFVVPGAGAPAESHLDALTFDVGV